MNCPTWDASTSTCRQVCSAKRRNLPPTRNPAEWFNVATLSVSSSNVVMTLETPIPFAGLQDQIIVFMALSKEPSEIRCGPISGHTQTAIHFAQLLTSATFQVVESPGGNILICSGAGQEKK
jgi:hypothetical protein